MQKAETVKTQKNRQQDKGKLEQLKKLSQDYKKCIAEIQRFESHYLQNKHQYVSSLSNSSSVTLCNGEQKESFVNYEQRKIGLYIYQQAILLRIDRIRVEQELKNWEKIKNQIKPNETEILKQIDEQIEIAKCRQYQTIDKLKVYESAKQFIKVCKELEQPPLVHPFNKKGSIKIHQQFKQPEAKLQFIENSKIIKLEAGKYIEDSMIKEGLIDEREPGNIDGFFSPNMLSSVQNDKKRNLVEGMLSSKAQNMFDSKNVEQQVKQILRQKPADTISIALQPDQRTEISGINENQFNGQLKALVENGPQLQGINIDDNQITDAGLKELVENGHKFHMK